MPKACYLSGPMTGYPANNAHRFKLYQDMLTAHGWTVFNPAEMESKSVGNPVGNPPLLRELARKDLLCILDKLRVEDGDALVMLPNWQYSRGARAEWALAEWLGLDRITLEEACQSS